MIQNINSYPLEIRDLPYFLSYTIFGRKITGPATIAKIVTDLDFDINRI